MGTKNGRPSAPKGAKSKWADGRVVEKKGSGKWDFTGGSANGWNKGSGSSAPASGSQGSKVIAKQYKVLPDGSVAKASFSGDTKVIQRVRKT